MFWPFRALVARPVARPVIQSKILGSMHARGLKRRADDGLRLLLDLGEVVGADEALGVDLVDVLGARGAGGEPAVLGRRP